VALASPFSIASATADYVISLSENLDSFDDARHVSTDCIFDELRAAVEASAKTLAVAIDQIPASNHDARLFLEFKVRLYRTCHSPTNVKGQPDRGSDKMGHASVGDHIRRRRDGRFGFFA
jgi:hypothetical protein